MSSWNHAALLTDLYQLTMAYGYWKQETAERRAVFHLFFRSLPFGGGYAVAAGLEDALAWLCGFQFRKADLDYLANLKTKGEEPLFDEPFLAYLDALELDLEIDALPEGTLVFPSEPILRVEGPLLQCQLVESALLNFINFETLIATKAARICQAAEGDSIMEFGLRRAQGTDGAMAASRAAFIGGCGSTSNVAAGQMFGIPVKGTHAHSWVMSFGTEQEAFEAYAEAMPDNCIFLVDTYDTHRGIERAIAVGRQLRERGSEMVGIRLDSGDLLSLSIDARRMLDEAGFPEAAIVASDELDEYRIAELKSAGTRINVWGVGTRLVTAFDNPALGGVYKLAAIQDAKGNWHPKLKISSDPAKTTLPGKLQTVRVFQHGEMTADFLVNEFEPLPPMLEGVDSRDLNHPLKANESAETIPLLQPVISHGKRTAKAPPLAEAQQRTLHELSRLPEPFKRLHDPIPYPVAIERSLQDLRVRVANPSSPGHHESS